MPAGLVLHREKLNKRYKSKGKRAPKLELVGGRNEKWQFIGQPTDPEIDSEYNTIIAAQLSGRCLEVGQSSQAENARVAQYDCDTGKNQNFKRIAVGDSFQLKAQHSDKCLGVEGASQSRRARVVQMSCSSATNQLWSATGTGDDIQLRVKHSGMCMNVLQQDGRVIAGGGGLCGDCRTNQPDVEILSPPNLFDANGELATRPVISNAPTNATHGENIVVLMDQNASHDFALLRTATATHSVNNDQRRIPVVANALGGGQFSLRIHANPSVLVPGNYFLFALNAQGVPSVARVINIR